MKHSGRDEVVYIPVDSKPEEVTALYHEDNDILFITLEKGTPEQIVNHKSTPEMFKRLSDSIEVVKLEI